MAAKFLTIITALLLPNSNGLCAGTKMGKGDTDELKWGGETPTEWNGAGSAPVSQLDWGSKALFDVCRN